MAGRASGVARAGREAMSARGRARMPGTAEPGTIVAIDGDGLHVATGEGTVVIREIQPPGRKRMTPGATRHRARDRDR